MSDETLILKRPNLTDRQLQSIRFLARGMTAKEVATVMVINRDTLYKHLHGAKKAFGVKTYGQLMAMAGAQGLLDADLKIEEKASNE